MSEKFRFNELMRSLDNYAWYPRIKSPTTRRAYRSALLTMQDAAGIPNDTAISYEDFDRIREALGKRDGLKPETADAYMDRLEMVLKTVARNSTPGGAPPPQGHAVVETTDFPLRQGIRVPIPLDITRAEAERLNAFVSSLIIDD